MNRNTIMTSKFKWQVSLVWLALMIGFIWFIAKFDLDMAYVWEKLPFLAGLHLSPDGFIQGVPLTIYVCVIAMLASVILGLLAALGRLSLNPLAYGISTFYTSFFRGTPLLLQVLLIYQGLPQIGPIPTAIPSGIIALALCYGAYLSEIFRSAIVAIPRGQWEAAMALGLKKHQTFLKVILPQSMKVAIPPGMAMFIAMLKDSSLVSVMGLWEIMFLAQSYGRSAYRYMEMLITAAVIYWILSFLLELIQARLEKVFHGGKTR
ncbi:MAG: amino acid ABC transporter permease [Tolumonas sp.]|uniref:amino acid ABC transporter permease n=1 Tax=Tolumonas auensis TaxID=43948 RepID=UPI001B3CAAF8|nr:amino acid ABC transporter permease [Tolumonas auensis]MBP7980654.1 amino acid ABC transporter permease [Tolumonas sp.]NCB57360.1 amino acid ABC transporter permease [Gammaproteobacteria bacterium]